MNVPVPTLESDDHLALGQQLCFALYRASNRITHHYRLLLAPLGITYTQYLVLLVLWRRSGLTQTALCRLLDLDAGALSPVLVRMQRRGWLRRERDTDDGRAWRMTLTPAGHALRAEVAPLQREVARRAGLSDSAFRDLRHRLHALSDRLEAEAEVGVTSEKA